MIRGLQGALEGATASLGAESRRDLGAFQQKRLAARQYGALFTVMIFLIGETLSLISTVHEYTCNLVGSESICARQYICVHSD